MAEDVSYRRHVSPKHLEVLAQYMERYPPLALASIRSREGHLQSKRMWEKIARTLNRIDETVTKSGKCWARYWIDLKFKIRRKFAIIRKCEADRIACSQQLTPFEERMVKVLTDDEGNMLPTALVYHQVVSNYGKSKGIEKAHVKTKKSDKISKKHDTGGVDPREDGHSHDEDIYTTSNSTDGCRTELVNILEREEKPNLNHLKEAQDPIQLPLEDRKSIDELRRELVEFELKRQKEMFEMEKEHRKEKHELEMSILRIKKQILTKELKKL